MIIVLFHVLYLFGKLIYTRYNCCKQTQTTDTAITECCGGVMDSPRKNRNFAMEKLAQPPGDNSDDEPDLESKISFFPPAYIQRYIAVQGVLEEARYRGKLRKVLVIFVIFLSICIKVCIVCIYVSWPTNNCLCLVYNVPKLWIFTIYFKW